MKTEDIAKAASNISGLNVTEGNVIFLIEFPDAAPTQFHKEFDQETPYKEIKLKQKEQYKTIIATVKSLSALKSDDKGDYVECESITEQEPAHHPNVATNWGHDGLDLKTVSTPLGKSETM